MALLGGGRQRAQKTTDGAARPLPPDVAKPQLRCLPSPLPAAFPAPMLQVPPIKRRYDDVRQQVMAAQLSPSNQALQAAFRISQSTAQRYLRRLREEDIVSRRQHGHALADGQALDGAR